MAVSPALTLLDSSEGDIKATGAPPPGSAVVITLDDSLVQDVKKASSVPGGLQLLTGNVPRIRLGKRTIGLSVAPEVFRHELYSALADSASNLHLGGVVGHRVELNLPERKPSLGTDSALAALKDTLASYEREKQAAQTNISNVVMAVPKNRFQANREQKQAHRRGLLAHPATNPSTSGTSPHTSHLASLVPPTTESADRLQAMRTPLLHLLAMKPLTRDDILDTSHIPHHDLDNVLQKIGKPVGGKWQLSDKAYKELDVWKFKYTSQDDREKAIDNAVKAYDRQRIGKDEQIWQMLLPKEKRNKGIVLSRLHLGAGTANRPQPAPASKSPIPRGDAERATTAATTPKLGTTSGGALSKRLFAKDPQRHRAVETAKEKKRKAMEAAKTASDNEGGPPARKKQTTKTNNPKVKSAEFVRSSDEEEGEEEQKGRQHQAATGKPADTAASARKVTSTAAKDKKTTTSSSGSSSDAPLKTVRPKAPVKAAPSASSTDPALASASASAAKHTRTPSVVGQSTPNGLSAPTPRPRYQLSPQKPDSRPTIPSPLGAARPRVASDVSDRGAVGVQRVRQGAETPKGLGITTGVRKRHDTLTGMPSPMPTTSPPDKARKPAAPPEKAHAPPNGSSSPAGTKRPAVDPPSQGAQPASKHRKMESSSSLSHPSSSSVEADGRDRSDRASYMESLGQRFREVLYPRYERLWDEQHAMRARGEHIPPEDSERLADMAKRLLKTKNEILESEREASPARLHHHRGSGSTASTDSSVSIIDHITFSQGVSQAQRFLDDLYPKYVRLYDEQEALMARGETVLPEDRERLLVMHKRLQQIKHEIRAASEREHLDD